MNMVSQKIVFFDGVCNLCSGFVQFCLKRNKSNSLYFASLQSPFAKKNIPNHIIESIPSTGQNHGSVIYFKNGEFYSHSRAALEITKELDGLIYRSANLFSLIPESYLNMLYRLVAKNRYKLFGKTDSCYLPRPEWKSRFLDNENYLLDL